jgi:streptogramin lyase
MLTAARSCTTLSLLFAVAGCGHHDHGGATPDAGEVSVSDLAANEDGGPPAIDLAGPAPASGLTLLAGGLGGTGSADAIGTGARFYGVNNVTSDSAGHLYVADGGNDTIRQIDLASGVVTTLAGTPGSCGASDGVGAAALFCIPVALALDGAGHLFVADASNQTIRQIDLASRTVTTLAGKVKSIGSADGVGAAARFDDPFGLAFDGHDLYVMDTGNFAIRKIVIATGEVTTFAGSPQHQGYADGIGTAASFRVPYDIAADGHGNLFVAEGADHVIRQIVVASAAVTTLAGLAGTSGSVDGTGAAARFDVPHHVACDGSGNVYVTDANQNLRRLVVATGAVSTLAGTVGVTGSNDGPAAGALFKQPAGMVVDPTGALYLADAGNSVIRRIALATGDVTTAFGKLPQLGSTDGTGAAARFNAPRSIAVDGSGNAYVTDYGNHTIRKIVFESGAVSTFAGAAGVDGVVDGVGAAARFGPLADVITDGAGLLYVSDGTSIRRIDIATSAVTTLAGGVVSGNIDGIGSAAGFTYPIGLALDGNGNLYVADAGKTIRKLVLATAEVTTIAGNANVTGAGDGVGSNALFLGPTGMVYDGAGHLLIADSEAIRQLDLASATVTTIAGKLATIGASDGVGDAARFADPHDLMLDGAGNLYVADLGNHAVRKLTLSSGAVTTVVGLPAQKGVVPGPLPGKLSTPWGVALDSTSGALIVVDPGENVVLAAH